MKRMLLVACALAGLCVASAAFAEGAPAAVAPSLCSIMTSASGATSPAELPGLIPPPVSRTSHCGTCSVTPCKNANFGQACAASGHIGACRSQSGDTCPTDPTNFQCDCVWTPL